MDAGHQPVKINNRIVTTIIADGYIFFIIFCNLLFIKLIYFEYTAEMNRSSTQGNFRQKKPDRRCGPEVEFNF